MLNYIIKAFQISYSRLLFVNLDGFQKEYPCFHRTISIQIDSPLPQDDTQAVSRQSDLNYIIKLSKVHIIPDLPLILDSFKKETPCFHRTILIQIDSPLPHDDTQVVSRQSDVGLRNKSSQVHIIPDLSLILNGSKK